MTCCSYHIKDRKKSCRNSLFPEASRMALSRKRAPVVVPTYFLPVDTTNCRTFLEFHSSGNFLRRYFCWHNYDCICWLSHILQRKNRTSKPTQQGELREKDLLLKNWSIKNSPLKNGPMGTVTLSYFVAGANTKPLCASA